MEGLYIFAANTGNCAKEIAGENEDILILLVLLIKDG